MIRILIVDDHPSVRVGLVHVLKGEPGLLPVGAAADGAGALVHSRRAAVDVALLDYHLDGGEDGLLLCLELKQLEPPPGVVIYSGYAEEELVVGAHLVQADAILGKGAPVEELFDAVRAAARGECRLPAINRESAEWAREHVEESDRAVLELAMKGEPLARIAPAQTGGAQRALDSLRRVVRSLTPRTVERQDPAPIDPG